MARWPDIPDEVVERARALRAGGMSWMRIAALLGVGDDGLRRRLVPGYAERRAAAKRAAYAARSRGEKKRVQVNRVPSTGVTPDEAWRALASIPADTRDLTARLFGDPLPGRRALDHRNPNAESKEDVRA